MRQDVITVTCGMHQLVLLDEVDRLRLLSYDRGTETILADVPFAKEGYDARDLVRVLYKIEEQNADEELTLASAWMRRVVQFSGAEHIKLMIQVPSAVEEEDADLTDADDD